jgi:hypothetical protein
MRAQTHVLVIGLLVFTSAAVAPAQATQPVRGGDAQEPEVKVTTLVYDIRGLIRAAIDYPALPEWNLDGGGGGGGGGGESSKGISSREEPLPTDAYIRLIQATIDPDSWTDNGGEIGQIRVIQGRLVVTHTAEVHQRITEVLAKLQDSRMTRVRAHWLFFDPANSPLGEDRNQAIPRELDPAVLAKLPDDVTHLRAETVCFAGQTVHLMSGHQRSYVSDLSPIVGTQAVGSDPVTSIVNDGAILQVTPTLQHDGQSAVLDLQSVVVDLVSMDPSPLRATAQVATTGPAGLSRPIPADVELVLERPKLLRQQLRTTVRVPLGKPVVIGGMTLEPTSKGENRTQLVLVVEVTAG